MWCPFFCEQDYLLGGQFWAMGRFNSLGGQDYLQGGQIPTQVICYLPPWLPSYQIKDVTTRVPPVPTIVPSSLILWPLFARHFFPIQHYGLSVATAIYGISSPMCKPFLHLIFCEGTNSKALSLVKPSHTYPLEFVDYSFFFFFKKIMLQIKKKK